MRTTNVMLRVRVWICNLGLVVAIDICPQKEVISVRGKLIGDDWAFHNDYHTVHIKKKVKHQL